MSALDNELVDILVCPETRQPVRLADAALIARVNAAISDGTVTHRDGRPVDVLLHEGLLRDDGRILYPVRDGIPIMLLDEAIELSQVDAAVSPDSPSS